VVLVPGEFQDDLKPADAKKIRVERAHLHGGRCVDPD